MRQSRPTTAKRQRLGRRCVWAAPLLLGYLLPGNTWLVQAQTATTSAQTNATIDNTAQVTYSDPSGTDFNTPTNTVSTTTSLPLVDPRGQILGCGGQVLEDYSGFTVSLYEPNPADPTGTELGRLVPLTTTELPDLPNNGIPAGIEPNTENLNPFSLSNATEGRYSFLLDRDRGQIGIGTQYILVVNPPANSIYNQRRVRIQITDITPVGSRDQVSYQATSLDGLPIGLEGETELTQTVITVRDADRFGLQLLAVQFTNALCQVSQIQITKAGDRANAAPGDTVIYRLTIRNIADGDLDGLAVTDILPMGFKFLSDSVQAELDGTPLNLDVVHSEGTLTFSSATTLPLDGTINLVYAAQLTPDALRGRGQNLASVTAQRVDNDLEVQDGPAIHRVRITPGIVTDCGTVLGRVFVDKNFDGEQQPGEPGVPNAVVWMDDGNRITTDEDGLFHVKCVLPGNRTGALDLTTLPGYTLAPNLRFIERNSPSRLVRLSPGGQVRMNFGVTPSFQEGSQ